MADTEQRCVKVQWGQRDVTTIALSPIFRFRLPHVNRAPLIRLVLDSRLLQDHWTEDGTCVHQDGHWVVWRSLQLLAPNGRKLPGGEYTIEATVHCHPEGNFPAVFYYARIPFTVEAQPMHETNIQIDEVTGSILHDMFGLLGAGQKTNLKIKKIDNSLVREMPQASVPTATPVRESTPASKADEKVYPLIYMDHPPVRQSFPPPNSDRDLASRAPVARRPPQINAEVTTPDRKQTWKLRLTGLDVNDETLEALDQIPGFRARFQRLSLSVPRNLGEFAGLTSLEFVGTRVSSRSIPALSSVAHLQILDLKGTKIGPQDLRGLENQFASLQTVYFFDQTLEGESLKKLLSTGKASP